MSKFKVGDKVRLVGDDWGDWFLPNEIYTVTDVWLESEGFNVDGHPVSSKFVDDFELVESPETSNEKPPYLSFFTSVIVAKNKAVSDIGELLYDENTTKIYLEDEGGGAFLILEQDYDGAIQQIRLDIDEVDAVFSAIKQLVNQLEVK